MVTLSDARIDELIAEDVPYIDLTSHILGVDTQAGAMEYFTREACMLAGGEVASRIATKLGCVVTYILPDGVRGHLCIGPTMDRQILRELFAGYLAAAAKLSVTNETTCAAAAILPRLRPTQIGSDGRLLEWGGEYGEAEPGHRHTSG